MKQADIKIAIGTGSSRGNNEHVLKQTGIGAHFKVIVCADDVKRGKPDPETFLKAAELLGESPKNCVVIGDTDNDRLGAKQGGMKFVMVSPKKKLEEYHDHLAPDVIIKSPTELSLELLQRL